MENRYQAIEVIGNSLRRVAHMRKRADVEIKSVLGWPASIWGLGPDWLNKYWGGSRPLSNLIAGSLAGALGGYGLGWLSEKVLPDEYFEKKRQRRTGALLGALAGAVPGLYQTYDALSQGKSVLAKSGNYDCGALDRLTTAFSKREPSIRKAAQWMPAQAVAPFEPTILRDRFNRIVWDDEQTPLNVRTATTGLVEAAGISRGDIPFISPMDIARISVGMGSGIGSGLIVGKTLGALAGLKPESQRKLQDAGAWAGLLTAVVPMAFGR